MYVHNVADLPNLTLTCSKNLVPGLIRLLLLGLWWTHYTFHVLYALTQLPLLALVRRELSRGYPDD